MAKNGDLDRSDTAAGILKTNLFPDKGIGHGAIFDRNEEFQGDVLAFLAEGAVI